VPREYVQTKANLIGLLKEYAALGGSKIRLNLIETERFSPEAKDAQTRFGIEARKVFSTEQSRQSQLEIYMGVALTSGLEEVIVPFVDRGLPVEYELTRSIRTVSRAKRKKVGILNTDAKLMGGFDFQSMGQESEWAIVTELKKQYEVSTVSADDGIPGEFDVLLVAQPSSLTQRQIDNLTAYVRKGKPVLLFVDPAPVLNLQLAPSSPRQPMGGPFGGQPPPEPKGNIRPLMDLIGLDWPDDLIVWDRYNPHPQLQFDDPEIVFVGRGSGQAEAFNTSQPASSGLQEAVLLYPGLLRPKGSAAMKFVGLMQSSDAGGTIAFHEIVRPGLFGQSLNRNRIHIPSHEAYTLAAQLKGPIESAPEPKKSESKDAQKESASDHPAQLSAIVIADLDMISDRIFEIRTSRPADYDYLDFDNVSFVLNCVDVLAGDESFIQLRKRRPEHRTLRALEAQAKGFIKKSEDEEKVAEDDAKKQRELAQQHLDNEVKRVRENKEYDARTKEIVLDSLEQVENRRLEVTKAKIDDAKRKRIEESRTNKERSIKGIENSIRFLAVAVPPLPALLLGLLVYGVRLGRENQGANPNRLA
jgi:ABC-2 type transport system permease protein